MGRFGNAMLVGGEADLQPLPRPGEIVRLYLTNTANTRVFNVAVPGARMKLVGGDSGRVEHEQLVESLIIAPSERVVVDILFETAGAVARAPPTRPTPTRAHVSGGGVGTERAPRRRGPPRAASPRFGTTRNGRRSAN